VTGHVPKREAESAAGGPAASRRKAAAEDAQLVRRAQAGDVEAFEELVRRHQRRVLAIVSGILRRREDVEDVAQQVLVKVFLSLKRFDLRSAFPTWLYKVTVNECWDYLRKKRARPLMYESDLSEDQARQYTGERHAEGGVDQQADAEKRTELRDLLDRLMEELSREEQLMLVLKEVEGLSVEEIGEVLDLNVNTVKVKLFRARGRLMRLYRKELQARR